MTTIASGAAAPTVFSFDSHSVRTLVIEGEPWFVAADVCEALCISNNRNATSRLDDEEKGVRTMDTPSGPQEMGVINESGLYSLILGSRKPEAKRFKRWVTSEVLPSIRRTGAYLSGRRSDEGEMQQRISRRAWALALDSFERYRAELAAEVDRGLLVDPVEEWQPKECRRQFLEQIGSVLYMMNTFSSGIARQGRALAERGGVDWEAVVSTYAPGQ